MKHCPACLHENHDESVACVSCGYAFDSSLDSARTRFEETGPSSRFEPGDIIAGRYLVERILGQGGMGVVYLVRDQVLRGNRIALKMVHPGLVEHPQALQRFEEEVLTSQRLTHTNIVRVHDIKRADALRFFTMEYLDGQSLRQWMGVRKAQQPPFCVAEACAVVCQTLDALAYAHQHTVHRDIKPENIMVLGDFPKVAVKLLDFGIARTMSNPRFTQASQMLGTAYYMAPEQLQRSGAIDHRADLYAVGMVLYEMLTGKMAVGRFHLPGEIIDGIPAELDAFVDRALAPEPEQRFQDAAAMRGLLEEIVRSRVVDDAVEVAVAAPPPPEPEAVVSKTEHRTAPSAIGRKRALIGLIPLIVVLIGGGWLAFTHWSKMPVLTVRTTPPGAAVYVDGKPAGSSPASIKRLSDGLHTVRIEKERYAVREEQVTIRQGAPGTLQVALEPLPVGDLKITSVPQGAQVLIDGEPRGTTPAVVEMLPKGRRTVVLQKENFEPWQESVDIVSAETVALEARLVSSFGALDVTTDPVGADVFLDGKNVGKAPLLLEKLAKGAHQVSARKPCYADEKQQVKVFSGKTATLSITLATICGSAAVSSDPVGATVYLDGETLGRTPIDVANLSQGNRMLRFEKKGYPPREESVFITAGQHATLSVSLSREWNEPYTNMAFVWVPEGCFQMGCWSGAAKCEADEQPAHEVCLDGFWMAKYEVTQYQWKKVMGDNPASFQKGDDWPVEQVSWNAVNEFIDKLNTLGNGRYRLKLPSEAQWEYAARSRGRQEAFASAGEIDAVAWFNANSRGATHPVGAKAPNGLGLYDMIGNVQEWCEDVYHGLAYTQDAHTNPMGTSGGEMRVIRGASWFDAPRDVRAIRRGGHDPDYQISFVGFRLAAQ
jgi:formylglycine-generating enzyme required for sulfatase activity/predicted Ser/Thr protein kinase